MRSDEAFVGNSLVTFLGGPSTVSMQDGEDPPDLYLVFADSRVAVEVTQLSQFTFEPGGRLNNRTTEDSFGANLLDELNASLGPLLPDDISLFVILELPAANGPRFRKRLTAWIAQFASTALLGAKEEQKIEGCMVCVSAHRRDHRKRIWGALPNKNSSPDIGWNALTILQERVLTKTSRCKSLNKPIWLAMLNRYWLADAATYAAAAQQLCMDHCFERLFLVSLSGDVAELVSPHLQGAAR